MTTHEPKRAVAYLRRSRASEQKSVSLSQQRKEVEEWCQRNGYELAATFTDDGISGGKGASGRPGFAQALRMAERQEVQAVVSWKLDRVSRQGMVGMSELLAALGDQCRFIGVSDGVDSSTPSGRLIMAVLGELANSELENTRARARMSHRALKAQGRWAGGIAPFGTRTQPSPDGIGVVVVPEPTEAQAIKQAVGHIVFGETLRSIALKWNTQGLRTRHGKIFSARAVRRVIEAEAVQSVVLTPSEVEEWQRHTSNVGRNYSPPTGRPAMRLLTHVATCGSCGSPIRSRGGNRGAPQSYGCAAKPGECDRQVRVEQDRMDAEVERLWLEAFDHQPALFDFVESTEAADAIDDIARQLLAAQKRVQQTWSTEDLQEVQQLQKELDEARRDAPPVVKLIPSGKTMGELWREAGTTDERRAMLRESAHSIVIHQPVPRQPGWLEVTWKHEVQ